jgi:LDH2 family malate/lactate/ureidoglycolate dehydrogenase
MNIKITDAQELSYRILTKLGFPKEEQKLITENLIEAEMVERKSHGLSRLISISKFINGEKLYRLVRVGGEEMEIIKETANSLYYDAKYKAGFYAISKSLEYAIPKTKEKGIVTVGIKNAGYATGYIGAYARRSAENDLIFIGFNSIYGDLIPYGSIKALFGTNPFTVGIPTAESPIILDMASSKMTIGDIVVARNEGKNIPEGLALDGEGKPTIDPAKILNSGGVLPFAGHKGSGLAFIIELLAGALTGSSVGEVVPGGWGSLYILINPELFRSLLEFKKDIQKAIVELKNLPKAEGFQEILFPGERASRQRQIHLKSGEIEVSEKLISSLNEILHIS